MLKQVLHKIGSILLAFIVLFSSFSFTVHEHLCRDKITDVSYFSEANSCDMVMIDCENNDISYQKIDKEPCCSDNSQIIQGNDINQQAQSSLEIPQVQFLKVFVVSYIALFNEITTTSLYNDYSSPLVVKNIQKLDEIYLI